MAPAGDGAVGADGAGVRTAGADGREGARRGIQAVQGVEAPADDRSVRAHATGKVVTGADGGEGSSRRVGLASYRSVAVGVAAPAGDGAVGADAAGVAFAGVDGNPTGGGLGAAEGPGEETADILPVVALAGGFGGGAGSEGALVDLDVAGVAEMGFDDVVEFDAGGGPGGGGDGAGGAFVEGPGEDGANVVAVVGLAGLLGLLAKDPLVDADVAVVAEVGFDDVVEGDAGGGPLGQDGGAEGDGGGEGDDQDANLAHGLRP